MTDRILCPAQTYPQTRDTPAEYCENEVADYGDLCSVHDAAAREDDDYDRFLDAKFEDDQLSTWGEE